MGIKIVNHTDGGKAVLDTKTCRFYKLPDIPSRTTESTSLKLNGNVYNQNHPIETEYIPVFYSINQFRESPFKKCYTYCLYSECEKAKYAYKKKIEFKDEFLWLFNTERSANGYRRYNHAIDQMILSNVYLVEIAKADLKFNDFQIVSSVLVSK